MPRFIFKLKQSKDIAITPPLRPIISDADKGLFSSAECPDSNPVKRYEEQYNDHKKEIDKAVAENVFSNADSHALVAAIITQESDWSEDAISPCGAAGLMQLMPETAKGLGLKVPDYAILCEGNCANGCAIAYECNKNALDKCDKENDERFDPEKSIEAGAAYIAEQTKACPSLRGALANYYAGPGANCDFAEYPEYTEPVMGHYIAWQDCIKFAKPDYDWPVDNKYRTITLCFEDIDPPYNAADLHLGIDITGEDIEGKPVMAITSGNVDFVCADDDCGDSGKNVVIKHFDGRSSAYKHLSSVNVQKGTSVSKGDTIGTVGNTGKSTGPHLHFEILDESGRKTDPCEYLDCGGTKCTTTQEKTSFNTKETPCGTYGGYVCMDITSCNAQGGLFIQADYWTLCQISQGSSAVCCKIP